MSVVFNAEQHKYFNATTGEEYLSVSKILSGLKPEFDAANIAKFVAKRDGKTTEDVLAEWQATTDKACDFGTDFHAVMEAYIKNDKSWKDSPFAEDVESFAKISPLLPRSKKLSEVMLHSHKYKAAGTSDLIEVFGAGKYFNVYDFKTNKKFKMTSFKEQSLLDPVSHLPASNFITYSLQLSIYAYFYEKLSGLTPRYLALFHFDKETRTWTTIPVAYMKFEAMMILDASLEKRLAIKNNES